MMTTMEMALSLLGTADLAAFAADAIAAARSCRTWLGEDYDAAAVCGHKVLLADVAEAFGGDAEVVRAYLLACQISGLLRLCRCDLPAAAAAGLDRVMASEIAHLSATYHLVQAA